MKLRPSLKIYFIVTMLITGISTISIMSAVSVHYFFEGIDYSMVDAMRSHAYKHPVRDGKPIQIERFTIATRWEDLPKPIRDNLNEDDLEDEQLSKLIDGIPLLSEPKAGYFAMRATRDGEVRYISSMFSSELDLQTNLPNDQFLPPRDKPNNHPQFIYIIVVALLGIILFSLMPYFILRKVTTPVERLMYWAKQLDKETLAQPVPDFHYSELNSLASMMKTSLLSVQEALVREQRFLGYASHELRTPIAVTRTNAELLRKMITKGIKEEKQHQVVDRIERACLTMTDLTETLLWLNRQPDKEIPIKPIVISKLIEQVLTELEYVRSGKEIELKLECDESCYPLPMSLCHIILTNLIRNAFQHTQQGIVTIKQCNNSITIINQNINTDSSPQHQDMNTQGDLGFGLGLELTKRLVQHYGWHYSNIACHTGHHVEISFIEKADK